MPLRALFDNTIIIFQFHRSVISVELQSNPPPTPPLGCVNRAFFCPPKNALMTHPTPTPFSWINIFWRHSWCSPRSQRSRRASVRGSGSWKPCNQSISFNQSINQHHSINQSLSFNQSINQSINIHGSFSHHNQQIYKSVYRSGEDSTIRKDKDMTNNLWIL